MVTFTALNLISFPCYVRLFHIRLLHYTMSLIALKVMRTSDCHLLVQSERLNPTGSGFDWWLGDDDFAASHLHRQFEYLTCDFVVTDRTLTDYSWSVLIGSIRLSSPPHCWGSWTNQAACIQMSDLSFILWFTRPTFMLLLHFHRPYSAVWLFDYLTIWLFDYLIIWLFDYLIIFDSVILLLW